MASKKKPAKRKRQPSVKTVAKRVAKSLGAKPNTPELRRAVKFFNEADAGLINDRIGRSFIRQMGELTNVEDCAVPAWWATYDGRTERIPGEPDRWFRARGDALVLFSERLGYAVSQDSIELVWSDRKPDPPPFVIEPTFCACIAVGAKEFFCSEHAEKKA